MYFRQTFYKCEIALEQRPIHSYQNLIFYIQLSKWYVIESRSYCFICLVWIHLHSNRYFLSTCLKSIFLSGFTHVYFGAYKILKKAVLRLPLRDVYASHCWLYTNNTNKHTALKIHYYFYFYIVLAHMLARLVVITRFINNKNNLWI